jgi:acyl-coenzyme A thioesterase PaaI-like protein
MDTQMIATLTEEPVITHPCHDHCFACGKLHPAGLGLRFTADANGAVSAFWQPSESYQSYPDRLHGGVVSTLLDCAMVHALFARGVLHVRYLRAASFSELLWITGRVVSQRLSLYFCEAEVFQESLPVARATAKFMTM